MFYIYGTRRDDVTRYYWNRRKNEWELELTSACHYPTRKGVNRIYAGFVRDYFTLGKRFHEIGFKYQEAM